VSSRILFSGWRTFYGKLPDHVTIIWPGQGAVVGYRAASATRSAPATRPAGSGGEPPRRRRLTAEARKSSILAAARRAFSETGDMNGTTIRLA
jgi:hypothetical protein